MIKTYNFFIIFFAFSSFVVSAQTFTHYSYDEGSNVNHVKYDAASGKVWLCEFGPDNPLRYYQNGVFAEVPEVNGYITDMQIAPNGDVWVSSLSGTYQYAQGQVTHYTIENSPILEGTACVGFMNDAVYVGSNNGLYKYENDIWEEVDNFINVRSIQYDAQNDILYIGTLAYLKKIDADGISEIDWTNSNIPFSSILGLDLDTNGNLWLRSDGNGIAKYDGSTFTHYTQDNSSLLSDQVYSLQADEVGGVWSGFSGIYGVNHFDGNEWSSYTPENSEYPDFQTGRSIAGGEEDEYWIGIYQGLLKLDFSPTSTSEYLSEIKMTISPNPVHNQVTFQSSQYDPITVNIYTASGHFLQRITFSQRATLDISHYTPGIYFAKVINRTDAALIPFVVQ